MILHLEAPPRPRPVVGSVLAVEDNPRRAHALTDLLREYDDVELKIVPDVTEARRAIVRRVPDLVITSAFLSPSDEAELMAELKSRPDASHVQVLITPHVTSPNFATVQARRGLGFRRAQPTGAAPFDVDWLRRQITEYLERARAEAAVAEDLARWRESQLQPPETALIVPARPHLHLVAAKDEEIDEAAGALIRRFTYAVDKNRDRRRAPRLSSADLPWLWSARLGSGPEVKLVDVSNTGVLVETATKLPLGSTVDLRLVGRDTDVTMPANVLRTAVSEVNPLGVRYHVAAAFSRELRLMDMAAKHGGVPPAALAEFTRHEIENSIPGLVLSAARVRFEQELRRLVNVRDVLIRRTPVVPHDDAESLYFSIPDSSSILQVIFERDHAPSPTEFHVLKAAARLAAAVLELNPVQQESPQPVEALAG